MLCSRFFCLAVIFMFMASLVWAIPCAVQAKLGENYARFQATAAKGFKYKGRKDKDNHSYYMFTMQLDDATLTAAPGFSGGLTVTVAAGKIIGQSMVLRLGENIEAGKVLAAVHVIDFIYEALGRPNPKSKEAVAEELRSYESAIDQCLEDIPQKVKYPDTPGKIIISKTQAGDIAVACTADNSPEPATPSTSAPASAPGLQK